jgi:hypothetical protein
MRKHLLSFLIASTLLSQTFPAPGPNVPHVPHALVSSAWTLVSSTTSNTSCIYTTNNCDVVATIGAGHLLVFYSYTNSAVSYSSATGDSFTHCPASAASSGSGSYSVDCAYVLSAAGGTNVAYTFTWSGNTSGIVVILLEYSYSGGSITYDTGNGATVGTNSSGPPLTLSGTDDVIVQVNAAPCTPTGISGAAYTNPSFLGDAAHLGAIAGATNQTSYSAPAWTSACSYFSTAVSAVAFK